MFKTIDTRRLHFLALALALVLASRGALAQCPVNELLAPISAPGSGFGEEMAISGSRVIVADTYRTTTPVQVHIGRLVGTGWSPEAVFYLTHVSAVDIDGNWAIVGQASHDPALSTVSIFNYDPTSKSWAHYQTLRPQQPTARWGYDVAIEGSVALVGSLSKIAEVFELNGSQWMMKHQFTPSVGGSGWYGNSVDISGSTIMVADAYSAEAGQYNGSVYFYERVGTGYVTQQFFPDRTNTGHYLGLSIAVDGNWAVAGAPWNSPKGWATGSAYVYRKVGNTWQQHGDPVFPTQTVIQAHFGSRVDIRDRGDQALLGIAAASLGSGTAWSVSCTAYTFRGNRTLGWEEQIALPEDEPDRFAAGFGQSLALGEGALYVGTPEHLHQGGPNKGSVYYFDLSCDPAAPRLTVSPSPMKSRQQATLTVTQANPNAATWLFYSFQGRGSHYWPSLNVLLDLHRAQRIPRPRITDASGRASWNFLIPASSSNKLPIWLQAAQSGLVTQAVETAITK